MLTLFALTLFVSSALLFLVQPRSSDDLLLLATDGRWVRPTCNADGPVWTDDFSNIISVINRKQAACTAGAPRSQH